MFWITISQGVLALAVLLVVITLFRLALRPRNLPPKVHPLVDIPIPIIGDLLNFYVFWKLTKQADKAKPWEQDIELFKKYGPVQRAPFLHKCCICVGGIEGVQLGLTLRDEKREKVLGTQSVSSLVAVWGKTALANVSGSEHARIKRLVAPTLSPQVMVSFVEPMEKACIEWTERMIGQKMVEDEKGVHADIKVFPVVQEFTMVMPLRMALGLENAPEIVTEIHDYLVAMWTGTFSVPWSKQYKKALASREALLPVVRRLIKERRGQNTEGRNDLLSQLLRNDKGLKDHEIIDQVVTVMLAGYETSVAAICAALHYLALSPETLTKLRQEQSHFATGSISYTDVREMKILHNFLLECLRVNTPVQTFFRSIEKDFTFKGFAMPKGYLLRYFLAGSQRNTVPDPDELRPERHDPAQMDPSSPLAYRFGFTPFGRGEYQCPGEHFFYLESKMLLREIIVRYNIEHLQEKPGMHYDPFLRFTDQLHLRFRPIIKTD